MTSRTRTPTTPPASKATRRRRIAVSTCLALAGILASIVVAPQATLAQDAPATTRAEVVVGSLYPQPVKYFHGDEAGGNRLHTPEDAALIPGIAVRQHPVNTGLFDTGGCAQCHRLSGPLPPDAGAPPDVFDRLSVARIDTPAPEGFVRLTTSDAREEYPSWSPDGRHILYEVADDTGAYDLWLVGVDGSAPRQITRHASAGWATWHPDGDRIVYWASDAPGTSDLWLYRVGSGRRERLTNHSMTAWPQWSPDGEWIVYQARDERGWRLYLLDVATGRERELSQVPDNLPSRPVWSPDGSQIVYQSLAGTGFQVTRLTFPTDDTGTLDYHATPRRMATTRFYPIDLGAAAQLPAWNPAGDRLAFVMYTLDTLPSGTPVFTYKAWTTDPDGTRPRLLVPTGTIADRSPSWSPDGAWLTLWAWDTESRAGVWIVDAAARRRYELTARLGGDALYPAWSPGSDRIAFAANREGSFDIWIADVARVLDGSVGARPDPSTATARDE